MSKLTTKGEVAKAIKRLSIGKCPGAYSIPAEIYVHEVTARDYLFADDCALNDSSQFDMQKSMDLSSQACNDFRHTISTKKREVMHQPAPEAPYTEPHITVTGQRLAVTGKFVYLPTKTPKCTSGQRWRASTPS